MGIIHAIDQLDQKVLLFINGLHASVLDPVMWAISNKAFWYPFYLVLIVFIILKRKKDVWITLIVVAIMIILSDQLADFIKDHVQRLRPTHNASISDIVHILRGYRGGDFGFVSSHASNAFAVAAFTSLLFARRWFTLVIYFWAVIISYSRMYLGVHYPLDVLCGGLLGFSIGIIMFYLERWVINYVNQKRAR
jgi:undecaprenyl-diphosphatase